MTVQVDCLTCFVNIQTYFTCNIIKQICQNNQSKSNRKTVICYLSSDLIRYYLLRYFLNITVFIKLSSFLLDILIYLYSQWLIILNFDIIRYCLLRCFSQYGSFIKLYKCVLDVLIYLSYCNSIVIMSFYCIGAESQTECEKS